MGRLSGPTTGELIAELEIVRERERSAAETCRQARADRDAARAANQQLASDLTNVRAELGVSGKSLAEALAENASLIRQCRELNAAIGRMTQDADTARHTREGHVRTIAELKGLLELARKAKDEAEKGKAILSSSCSTQARAAVIAETRRLVEELGRVERERDEARARVARLEDDRRDDDDEAPGPASHRRAAELLSQSAEILGGS